MGNALDQTVDELKRQFSSLKNVEYIDYSIAEISNTASSKASDLLTPQSFVFSSQPGVLNIFIKTKGSGRDEGSANPRFDLEYKYSYTPIPQGYGASIIIARQLFQDKYLIPNIKKRCPHLSADNPVKAKTVDKGITLELRYEKKYTIKGYFAGTGYTDYHFKDTDIDFDENPLLLEIGDEGENFSPQYNWNWHHDGVVKYKADSNSPFDYNNGEGSEKFSADVAKVSFFPTTDRYIHIIHSRFVLDEKTLGKD